MTIAVAIYARRGIRPDVNHLTTDVQIDICKDHIDQGLKNERYGDPILDDIEVSTYIEDDVLVNDGLPPEALSLLVTKEEAAHRPQLDALIADINDKEFDFIVIADMDAVVIHNRRIQEIMERSNKVIQMVDVIGDTQGPLDTSHISHSMASAVATRDEEKVLTASTFLRNRNKRQH